MRVIKLEEYNMETMKLAKPIVDKHQRVLLGANTSIHPKYMQLLQNMGISYIFVEDSESQGISLEEMLDMSIWMEMIRTYRDIVQQFLNKKINTASIHRLVGQILQEIKGRKVIVITPSSSIDAELQPYAHAVNVCFLSLQIGNKLGYNELQLRDLGVGSLLHDIGKFFTEKEEDHPEVGFKILKDVREINLLSAHVAYQHHETLDGLGYPRGIKGNTWIEYAQICGIANLYDRLISYKQMLPHQALEYIMSLSDVKYPKTIVDGFVNSIPTYPPGTKVILNDKEEYIVTRIDDHIQRPIVRHISSGKEISLSKSLTSFIIACI